MATNYVCEGERMNLPTADGAESGDVIMLGNHLPAVLITDADTASPYYATVHMPGGPVYHLSVKAHDGLVNSAVAFYDPLYFHSGETPALNKDDSGLFYGIALGEITSGSTASISVKQMGCCVVPDETS